MNVRSVARPLAVAACVLALGIAAATLLATSGVGGPDGTAGTAGDGEGDDRPIDGLDLRMVALVGLFLLVVDTGLAAQFGALRWRTVASVLVVTAVGVSIAAFWIDPFSTGTPVDASTVVTVTDTGAEGPKDHPVNRVRAPAIAAVVLVAIGMGAVTPVTRSERVRALLRVSIPEDSDGKPARRDELRSTVVERPVDPPARDNEVYRAWRDPTARVDVSSPDATTPREFAAAAEEAELSPEHVAELTRLFEAVRYGGYPPTADRARRAATAVRRLDVSEEDDGP